MRLYIVFAFLFSYILPGLNFTNATAVPEGSYAEALSRAMNLSSRGLEKRNEIDKWNHDHPANRIAARYVCPNPRVLFTVFDSMAVWEAFNRGVWFTQHSSEKRPRWSGIEYPHSITLEAYRARVVDLGRTDGTLYLFPLNPTSSGEWPGQSGDPGIGPPGEHRVVYCQHGIFSGVSVLFTEPDGIRMVWCYPMLDSGPRDMGATSEGNTGVDEAWRDSYDGHHYLYAPDPTSGSHPPGPT
ncbi:uncharacterized protein GGS22DRAFT_183653 [Annulohypoxylon maeteangense]|uniref:uncharacterized protein n=1 Tax=Annulohypoxylon maeteangense TaxID=1927788 RepID=UPI002007C31E|nr:uncharacterized protein GGS22DRAFT_183653 [Annulohypoxylon maeteangense]KAI0890306.1 hypothetical protein GGS22DRAFT_183653 [Annulohypoxylon maeteangense]